MASIGSVFVDFIARTATFNSGVAGAAGQVERAGITMEGTALATARLSTAMYGLAASLVGVLSFRELASVIEEADARMLKLGVTSRALGISVETLQAWDMAAGEVGVSTETINMAMERFEQRLGTAEIKTQKASSAFKLLGVSVQQLAEMPQGEVFALLATKIAGLQNPADRARVAMELFGRTGLQLMPLFQQGAAGIEEAKKQLEAMGVSLSRMDVSKIQVVNAEMVKAKTAWQGVENELALAFAPLLAGLAEKFVQLESSQNGFRSTFENLVDNMVKGFGWVMDALRMLKAFALETWAGFQLGAAVAYKSLQGLVFILNLVLYALDGLANGAIYVWNALAKGVELFAVGASVAFDKLVYLALAGFQKLAEATSSIFHVSLAGIKDSLTQWTHAVVADSLAQRDRLKEIWEAPIKAGTVNMNLDSTQDAMGDLAQKSLDSAKKTMQEANKLLSTPPPSAGITQWWDNVRTSVDKASVAMSKFASDTGTKVAPQLSKYAQMVGEEWDKAFNQAGDALAQFATTGKLDLKAFAASIIDDILKIMIKALILAPIMAYLGLGNMGASTGIISQLTGKAAGGPVDSNTAYLVGEKGPEIFTPSSSGTIIPNDKLGSMGGSGSQTNFNFSPQFASGVTRQDLAMMLPHFVQQAKQSITDGIRRGGSLQQTFARA